MVEAPINVIEHIESKVAAVKEREVYVHVHPFIESYLTKGIFKSVKKNWQKLHKKKIVVVPRDAFTMLEWKLMDKENKVL